MADTLQQEEFYFEVKDFSGGLQVNFPYSKASLNSLETATNCRLERNGVVSRRLRVDEQGLHALNKTGFPVAMLWCGPTSTLAKRILMVAYTKNDLSAVEVIAYDGTSWTTATQTIAYTGILPIGAQWVRETGGTEYVYFTNPEGNAVKYTIATPPVGTVIDGTVSTNFPQKCRHIAYFGKRIWAAGRRDEKRHIVFFSAIEGTDAAIPGLEDWDQNVNQLFIPTASGEEITAIFPFREGQLIIGTQQSIYLLAIGTANVDLDSELRLVSRHLGILSPFTMVHAGDDVIFMDSNGEIRSFSQLIGGEGAGPISIPLSYPIGDRIWTLSRNYLVLSTAAYYDDEYFLFAGETPGDVRHVYVFNTVTRSWTGPHQYNTVTPTAVYPYLGNAVPRLGSTPADVIFPNLWMIGADSGRRLVALKQEDKEFAETADLVPGDTDIVAVSMTATSNALDFGFPHQDKIIKWIEVEAWADINNIGASRNFTVEGRKDYGSWQSLGTFDYSGSVANPIRQKFKSLVVGRGRIFQFRFRKADTGPRPRIIRFWVSGTSFEPRDN